jgi:RHH-type transcriptional regulator, proline utilization regulon repressor / proline dehydrogenase / delta 1-pyrroline-5-carboxylate dehydrogenase
VQPFGGSGTSGTGPKAGGPLYLSRLSRRPSMAALDGLTVDDAPIRTYIDWLRATGRDHIADRLATARFPALVGIDLAGPVGERNLYALRPRGNVAAVAATEGGLLHQLGTILGSGNRAVLIVPPSGRIGFPGLAPEITARISWATDLDAAPVMHAVLFEGDAAGLLRLNRAIAARPGAILPIQARTPEALAEGDGYAAAGLVEEVSTAINTAAAGGNASLMSIG